MGENKQKIYTDIHDLIEKEGLKRGDWAYLDDDSSACKEVKQMWNCLSYIAFHNDLRIRKLHNKVPKYEYGQNLSNVSYIYKILYNVETETFAYDIKGIKGITRIEESDMNDLITINEKE